MQAVSSCTNEKADKFQVVCDILKRHHYRPEKLIPILQEVQHEYRYLPESVLLFIATGLGLSPAQVYGVATFYAHFTLEPMGKHVVRLCDGTACHVKGSVAILEAIRKRVGLPEDKKTTDDMLFTVETVACLGACGLAPAVVIDGAVHGPMTPESAVALIDEILQVEAKEKN